MIVNRVQRADTVHPKAEHLTMGFVMQVIFVSKERTRPGHRISCAHPVITVRKMSEIPYRANLARTTLAWD